MPRTAKVRTRMDTLPTPIIVALARYYSHRAAQTHHNVHWDKDSDLRYIGECAQIYKCMGWHAIAGTFWFTRNGWIVAVNESTYTDILIWYKNRTVITTTECTPEGRK